MLRAREKEGRKVEERREEGVQGVSMCFFPFFFFAFEFFSVSILFFLSSR